MLVMTAEGNPQFFRTFDLFVYYLFNSYIREYSMNKIAAYFAGAQQEFKLIKWPTATETRNLTIVVIAVSIGLAAFLGIFDYLFSYGLGQVV